MRTIREYDQVRVVKLLSRDLQFEGSDRVVREPRIGDVATVCHEYEPRNSAGLLAVEKVDENGQTIWLADFIRDELELISTD